MSSTTKIYLYNQCQRVVLLDTTGEYFSRRYNTVYSKTLKAHRGTDNQILMQFVNQDQKRVDLRTEHITTTTVTAGSFVVGLEYTILTVGTTDFTLIGSADNNIGTLFTSTGIGAGTGTADNDVSTYHDMTFTCRLISTDGEKLLLQKFLTPVNLTQGQTKLILTESELDKIAPGLISFSVERHLDNEHLPIINEPVFVDDNSGGRGNMEILDSILPAFTASKVLTLPVPFINITSILDTDDTDLHTFQFDLDQYTGDIVAEGASDPTSAWYTISTSSLTLSDLFSLNIAGYHPYIRFTFIQTSGTVTQILYR